jgi:hypothetical protein
MADQVQPTPAPDDVPPVSEQIHLPGPSYLPIVTALGITIALVGVILNWIICGFGVLVTVIAVVRWIGSTREDIAELPLEH